MYFQFKQNLIFHRHLSVHQRLAPREIDGVGTSLPERERQATGKIWRQRQQQDDLELGRVIVLPSIKGSNPTRQVRLWLAKVCSCPSAIVRLHRQNALNILLSRFALPQRESWKTTSSLYRCSPFFLLPSLSKQFPIERSIIDGLRDVMDLYFFYPFKIGNRPRHFEYSVIPSAREVNWVIAALSNSFVPPAISQCSLSSLAFICPLHFPPLIIASPWRVQPFFAPRRSFRPSVWRAAPRLIVWALRYGRRCGRAGAHLFGRDTSGHKASTTITGGMTGFL
ncbi:hypothetical protein IAD21_05440 [Abditibacteriota bacterium]|nr:hypothetical protein IAD21_05440 [Abditibacteriota bacterium]